MNGWVPFHLTAQANLDPLAGGSGWVGAGLLGLVLSWLLLRHLPEKDRQTRELLKEFRDETAELRRAFKADSAEARAAHKEALDRVCKEFRDEAGAERASCEKSFAALAAEIRRERSP